MRNEKVWPYYCILRKKAWSLRLKKAFDALASLLLIMLLAPAMALIALLIALDSGDLSYSSRSALRNTVESFRFTNLGRW